MHWATVPTALAAVAAICRTRSFVAYAFDVRQIGPRRGSNISGVVANECLLYTTPGGYIGLLCSDNGLTGELLK